MNATIESLFGPPSEPIDIPAFIDAAVAVVDANGDEPSLDVETCDVSDIREDLFHTWNNPRLSAHLSSSHEQHLLTLTKSAKSKRKTHNQKPSTLSSDVMALQDSLDAVKLSCWKLTGDSSTFVRSSKTSDHNVLTGVKPSSEPSGCLASHNKKAIITITVYHRTTWTSGYVNRSSQHAFLSSQTLGDIFQSMRCISNEISAQILGETNNGCVICIDNTVYGDGRCEDDYARKFLCHIEKISKVAPTFDISPTTIFETPLSSVKFQINKPYWLLHRGNCEHFVVIDQIRLQHPSDPRSGYPLTLQITPALLDLCRACAKVPAALSVIGDIRLGESPCLLCSPCWRIMGDSTECDVKVVELPRHEV